VRVVEPDSDLMADFSTSVAGADIGGLEQARGTILPGTRIHLAFVDSEDTAARVRTVRAIKRSGFLPVPILAARRLRSEAMLREYLAALRADGASGSVVIVGGDPALPRGPFADALAVIGSGLLEEQGVREVSVAGHPGGHPAVADAVLWQALDKKAIALEQHGLKGVVVTQFGFDAAQVLAWLARVRARGLSLPVRVSVPGPASVRKLLAIASRCDVSVSASAAREYGLSLEEPASTAAPDRFIRALVAGYEPELHGEVRLHFDAFSGIAATAEWISHFRGTPLFS